MGIEYKIRSFFLKIDQRDFLYSKILNFLYRIININKFLDKLKKKDIESFKDHQLNIDGFKQYQVDNNISYKVLSKLENIISSKDFVNKIGGKKNFLKSYKLDLFEKDNHIFFKFLFEQNILNRIIGYLGRNLTFAGASILYSENIIFEEGRSQNFHMDGEDLNQIKIFLYISDVDENSGPLTVLSKLDSRTLYNKYDQNRFIKKKTIRINDEILEKFSMKNCIHPLIGKKGTINLVDTSNCYHFGSRPGKKPRYVLMYQFLNSFSYYLPMKKNNINKALVDSEILNNKQISIINNITQYQKN